MLAAPLRRILLDSCYSLLPFLVVIVGCASPAPPMIQPVEPVAFQDLVKTLAQWRSLPVKNAISLTANSQVESNASRATPRVVLEGAYKSVGLLANNAQFGRMLSEYDRISRLIYYDRSTGTVDLAPDSARLAAPLAKINPRAARELTAALGIALALQEQHFDWRERMDSVTSEDRRDAFRALAGGDAALTALSLRQGKDGIERPIRELTLSLEIAAEIDRLAVSLPNYLRRQLTLPYRAGSAFVYWAFKASGWRGVNALYANPPLTTAEILHPEKYFVERAAPLRFFSAALLRRFKQSPSIDQSLGEDAIAALLAGTHTERAAEKTAAGWRGDQLWAFGGGAELTTVWLTSWTTEAQAREFLQAYRTVIEARHGVRFGFTSTPKNAPWVAGFGDKRGWLLQNRGSEVLLVTAAPANRITDLANDVWLDLEIDKEPTVLPFDWAKRPTQMSLTSR